MTSAIEQQIYRSSALVFEDLGFMLPNRELEDYQRELPFQAVVRVDFKGPVAGTLAVTVYGDLLPTLASNMLGEDEVSRRQQYDALGEVANVICGNLLPGIAGPKAVFQLSAPEVAAHPNSPPPAAELVAEVQVGLEEGRADVGLYLLGGLSGPVECHK